MKKLIFICSFIMIISSCTSKPDDNREILVRINDYKLTTDEFKKLFVEEMAFDSEFKPTRSAREEFLEGLIRKELLINEAVKLKLDRKEAFIRSIEKYWEATLIKELLELKNKEIQETTYVTQEEIEREYIRMKKEEGIDLPLENLSGDIRDRLDEKKKQQLIEKWMSELRNKAKVEINSTYLKKDQL